MSDNSVRYKAIRKALEKPYSAQPQGNFARHLNTLAGLISGIVGSKNSNLPEIADIVPDGAKRESRVKRHTRWLQNNNIDANAYLLPFASELLLNLIASSGTLVSAIDGSKEIKYVCLDCRMTVTDWFKQKGLLGERRACHDAL